MPRNLPPVQPGEWIRIPLGRDAFPVTMAIGDSPAQAAFIEHELADEGSVRTFALRRCPQLTPGSYTLEVRTAYEVIKARFRVH